MRPMFNTIQVILIIVAIIAAVSTFFISGVWSLLPLVIETAAVIGIFIERQRREKELKNGQE